ncbi:CDF family Co(II)/Ni(II) efflux transporter DmeF [Cohaesibacter sp. CAU 1516]|uniref:CDF family Co(II)/Ni(II) efflux transporter DmeF n=1 Tax=Cohaesibacter sp. CAU 1516 TaxID=2576038 RepID=UPI0010FDC686|nr:CDF family Co(II)/Ni(II) efflux transporter DmeF [Cohaesibacter sp. CAU 1516]TLP42808.1 CDF family Co(II)/Ni(II) efflux transporter DmeF [Cohaesibacter sp. CAU 1516]
MHIFQLEKWQHDHQFLDDDRNRKNARRTFYVVLLTIVTMVVEITAGMVFNSMALLADGWHMASHAGALGLTVLAYSLARKHAANRQFTFGVGKIEILGGYTNAVILGLVALFMIYESVLRLFNPLDIAFNEAMLVACLGLIVNLVSAYLLHEDGHHHHHHGHGHHHHDHGHHDHAHHDHHDHHASGKDHNMRAAYLHVMADALTSILAIVALLFGKHFGWTWMDAMMGLVGAFVIGKWAYGLVTETGSILLDRAPDEHLAQKAIQLIEADADNRVSDHHIWYIGSDRYAAILSVVTHYPRSAEHYKALLKPLQQIAHITIEVNVCTEEACMPIPDLETS